MPMARITITIPAELVEGADRKAEELDRSRSWVIVSALRSYLTGGATQAPSLVAESPAAYVAGLDASRRAQLEADLAMSLDERVRAAEQTALVGSMRRNERRVERVVAFDSLEDFFDWERRESIDL